jgi:hypothetical protein
LNRREGRGGCVRISFDFSHFSDSLYFSYSHRQRSRFIRSLIEVCLVVSCSTSNQIHACQLQMRMFFSAFESGFEELKILFAFCAEICSDERYRKAARPARQTVSSIQIGREQESCPTVRGVPIESISSLRSALGCQSGGSAPLTR